jgi:hypothetical protein
MYVLLGYIFSTQELLHTCVESILLKQAWIVMWLKCYTERKLSTLVLCIKYSTVIQREAHFQ